MGRFDALTQLDSTPTPPAPNAAPATPFADLLANQQGSKPANQQASKEVNQQGSTLANQQGSLPANQHASKEARKQTILLAKKHGSTEANQQGSKALKKFGSYLTPESIKALKRIAFETERKDYEVLQDAVDQYLAGQKPTR